MFPILLAESSAPLHSLCAFLIWLRIFNLAYLALIFRFTCFPYKIPSGEFIFIYLSSELYSASDSSSKHEIDLSSTKLR